MQRLGEAGVLFAVTSGRPPGACRCWSSPSALDTPIAAFNGGLIVERDMTVLEQKVVPPTGAADRLADRVVGLARHLDLPGRRVVRQDPEGPHVDREAWTVEFQPQSSTSYEDLTDRVVKIVGRERRPRCAWPGDRGGTERFGDHVSAAQSQPYYLDVTHPDANKGGVVRYLSARYEHPAAEIATIGDMPNDVLMFAHSGLSIAMGNASSRGPAGRPPGDDVQRGRRLCQRRRAVHPGQAVKAPLTRRSIQGCAYRMDQNDLVVLCR